MGQRFLPREAEEKHPTGSRHLRTSKSVCGASCRRQSAPPGWANHAAPFSHVLLFR